MSQSCRRAVGRPAESYERFFQRTSRASSPFEKPRSIDSGDLDQDGYTDLVFTELSNDRIWVLWGQEGETNQSDFQPPELLDEGRDESVSPIGDYADTPVLIRDLNNDGAPDIVKVNEIPNEVVILWGNRDVGATSHLSDHGQGPVDEQIRQTIPIADAVSPARSRQRISTGTVCWTW